jgi:hypothetical protein
MLMFEVAPIQMAPIVIVSCFVRAYPEDSLSDLEFSPELHFYSICKAESLFATE